MLKDRRSSSKKSIRETLNESTYSRRGGKKKSARKSKKQLKRRDSEEDEIFERLSKPVDHSKSKKKLERRLSRKPKVTAVSVNKKNSALISKYRNFIVNKFGAEKNSNCGGGEDLSDESENDRWNRADDFTTVFSKGKSKSRIAHKSYEGYRNPKGQGSSQRSRQYADERSRSHSRSRSSRRSRSRRQKWSDNDFEHTRDNRDDRDPANLRLKTSGYRVQSGSARRNEEYKNDRNQSSHRPSSHRTLTRPEEAHFLTSLNDLIRQEKDLEVKKI